MSLLRAGVDTSVIALWLGHQDAETTQVYLHADMTIKQQALAHVQPPAPAATGHPTPSSRSSTTSSHRQHPPGYADQATANRPLTRQPPGRVGITRASAYADDVVLGFQHRSDAERFRRELEQRLAKFRLGLNAEKTRLIRFGGYAAQQRAERGLGRPETFEFLGFTH
jgi:hypothetical protein